MFDDGTDFFLKLCAGFGISTERLRRVEIVCQAGVQPRVTIHRSAPIPDPEQLETLVEVYDVVRRA